MPLLCCCAELRCSQEQLWSDFAKLALTNQKLKPYWDILAAGQEADT
jgi:hypothetical protein